MFDLQDFLFKNVVVVDIECKEYRGYVDMYCSDYDNDDTEESIGIIPDKEAKSGIELYASEIKYIKEVK